MAVNEIALRYVNQRVSKRVLNVSMPRPQEWSNVKVADLASETIGDTQNHRTNVGIRHGLVAGRGSCYKFLKTARILHPLFDNLQAAPTADILHCKNVHYAEWINRKDRK